MPHQCIRCNTFYEDGSRAILKGCSCGSKLFFFIKKDRLVQLQETQEKLALSEQEREEMEKDIWDIVGENQAEKPVVLDLENIRVVKPGTYELDLVNLFQEEPLVFRLEEGKYIIDLVETFQRMKKKK